MNKSSLGLLLLTIAYNSAHAEYQVTTRNAIHGNPPTVKGRLVFAYNYGNGAELDITKLDLNADLNKIRLKRDQTELKYDDVDGDEMQSFTLTNMQTKWQIKNSAGEYVDYKFSTTLPDRNTLCYIADGTLKLIGSVDVMPISKYGNPRQGKTITFTEEVLPATAFIGVNTRANARRCYLLDSGFPTTAFHKATFNIYYPNQNESNYKWVSSNPAQVTVLDNNTGKIQFNESNPANPVLNPVEISLVNTSSETVFSYKFQLNRWFFLPPHTPPGRWALAKAKCEDVANTTGIAYRLPKDSAIDGGNERENLFPELTLEKSHSSINTAKQGVGALFSEWGPQYMEPSDPPWSAWSYWAEELSDSHAFYVDSAGNLRASIKTSPDSKPTEQSRGHNNIICVLER